MTRCCTAFRDVAGDQFGAGVASRDAAAYRRRGPDKPTRLMCDAVLRTNADRTSLLDIGGGMGALSLELTAAGVHHATVVDASESYLSAARGEAVRLDRADRLRLVAGDFVELAATLPVVDIVAMNRVICCYPQFDSLLSAALEHSAQVFAFSYPKDRWYIRAVTELGNKIRQLTGKAFRAFVHDESRMRALIEARGFRCETRRDTFVWQIEVWTR